MISLRGGGQWLQEHGWYLKESVCEELIGNDTCFSAVDPVDIDLRKCGSPILPFNFRSFCGPVVLQLHKLRNVAMPDNKQEQEGVPTLLRIHLTDGQKSCSGVVLEPIRGLSVKTPPGTKLRLFCPLEVEEDLLILSGANCKVLGGRVEELIAEWERNRIGKTAGRSAVSSNAPPWVPFGVDIEKLGHKITRNFVSLQNQIENTVPLSEEFALRREELVKQAMAKMTI